jgi:hypothetical protein
MKYIVAWLIITLSPDVCPDSAPKVDEIGRVSRLSYTCAVMHYRRDTARHERVFTIKDSATAFYNRLLAESKKTSDIASPTITSTNQNK